MSIVQEALKKVQKTPGKEYATVFRGSAVKGHGKASRILVIAVIAVLLIGIGGFALKAYIAIGNKLGEAVNKDIESKQRVTFKPLPAADQKPAPGLPVSGVNDKDVKSKYPRLVLSGIMYIEERPRAIINGSVVEEGGSISGAQVRQIRRDSVVLTFEDMEMTINLN